MKTFNLKPADVKRKWYVVDASEGTLGRVSSAIAKLLIGKGKPEYTPHVDNGDFVIVVNASFLKVTGNKMNDKSYYKHSGYPGNLRQKSLAEKMADSPSKVIFLAVRGMLPINKLRDGRLSRLKIYDGLEHEHSAQNPEKLKTEDLI